MAPMIFVKSIFKKEPLDLLWFYKNVQGFNLYRWCKRTIERCCYRPVKRNNDLNFLKPYASTFFASHLIFNIGSDKAIYILEFLEKL